MKRRLWCALVFLCAAVTLGACFIERHITLDRAMWGTDQAASVEMVGLKRLIAYIRDIERSLGDGVKRVYDSEAGSRKKLRRVPSAGHEAGLIFRAPAAASGEASIN